MNNHLLADNYSDIQKMIDDANSNHAPDASFSPQEMQNFQTMAAKEQAEYSQQHQPVSSVTSVYVGLVVAVVVAIVIGVIASIFMKKKQ